MQEQTPIKKILKPWGKEIWFARQADYVGKILFIKKGHRYSLQYHEKKIETQYVLKGKCKFLFGRAEEDLKEVILNPGDKLDIYPGIIHRAQALEDLEILEVSSNNLDDVVKLADDYGRKGKGNNFIQDAKLAEQQKR